MKKKDGSKTTRRRREDGLAYCELRKNEKTHEVWNDAFEIVLITFHLKFLLNNFYKSIVFINFAKKYNHAISCVFIPRLFGVGICRIFLVRFFINDLHERSAVAVFPDAVHISRFWLSLLVLGYTVLLQ